MSHQGFASQILHDVFLILFHDSDRNVVVQLFIYVHKRYVINMHQEFQYIH